jgi:hypothetical protein
MLKKIMISALGGAAIALGAAGAQAQDGVIVDDDGLVVHERIVEPDDDVIVDDDDAPGPQVYGWVADRPLDCGAYHYWDGADCVDARAVPPDTGYKD